MLKNLCLLGLGYSPKNEGRENQNRKKFKNFCHLKDLNKGPHGTNHGLIRPFIFIAFIRFIMLIMFVIFIPF